MRFDDGEMKWIGWVWHFFCERLSENQVSEEVKQNKNGLNRILSVKLIVTTYISSLIDTFNDET